MRNQGKPRETDLANAARKWYVGLIQPVAVIVLAALILAVAETALDFRTYMPVFQAEQRMQRERMDEEFARIDKRQDETDARVDRLMDRYRRYGQQDPPQDAVAFVSVALAAL